MQLNYPNSHQSVTQRKQKDAAKASKRALIERYQSKHLAVETQNVKPAATVAGTHSASKTQSTSETQSVSKIQSTTETQAVSKVQSTTETQATSKATKTSEVQTAAKMSATQGHPVSTMAQSQTATTGTQVATGQADVAQLKRQVRRLKRQLAREQAKNQKQIDEGLQQQINNKRRQHQAEEQVAIAQADVARLQTANDELTVTNHQLQQRVTAMQSYQDAAGRWFAQSAVLLKRQQGLYEKTMAERQRQRDEPVLTQKQRDKLQKYDAMVKQVKRLSKSVSEQEKRLAKGQKENEQLHRLRPTGVQNVSADEQVKQALAAGKYEQLRWLPRANKRYRRLLFDRVIIGDGEHVFGFFVNVGERLIFKTITGQTYSKYQRRFPANTPIQTGVVYGGVIAGQQLWLTDLFYDVTPSQLQRQHTQQLHRRRSHFDFRKVLPADAVDVCRGKRVMVVTWQRAQTLNQALRAFRMEPVIVNDHEKSIGWISQQIRSNQVDFTLLLSEGLSHSMLGTLGKTFINQSPDIQLVYNESPEELLRRCYAYFKR
ncbi:hypothetical protein KCA1_1441 [Lactiplantibacillus pentosus KCA1]|nr:hypothetical protein [Lactiplantibacillus pentosus]EIW13966.1 hypothetical protein KCA1_1441 [Lactiplantibacillus pentosus KCA1]